MILSALLVHVGGLSVLVGEYPDLGAFALPGFLLPTTLLVHAHGKHAD